MPASVLHPLVPGARLPGDWFAHALPANIAAGENTVIDSSFCFKHFFSRAKIGLRAGRNVTFWRTSLAAEEDGVIEIGDDCYFANAALICCAGIHIGSRVMVAGGVTIADADFHPLGPAARVEDTIALSPRGDRFHRPPAAVRPVVIDDDVWIGFNATILKGVHVGAGALIAPGAVVVRDVAAGAWVEGNPARVVRPGRAS